MHKPTAQRARRTLLFWIAIVLASVGLPHADEQAQDKHESTSQPSDASVVVRWSQLAHDNAFAVDPDMTDPFPSMRGWTMMYLAMHDALNAVVPTFQQYAFFGADKSAHPIAAVAQAARDVLNHIYPAREAENDAELAFWLSQIPDGPRKTRGIALGTASAAAIIALRASDNMLVPGEYVLLQHPLEPGDYRFVPPLEFVYRPAFRNAVPLAIGSGGDFLPPPATGPQHLGLCAIRRRNEGVRSPEQHVPHRGPDQRCRLVA